MLVAVPTTALPFCTNCRKLPWIVRVAAASSSPSRVLTTGRKLNPKSTPVAPVATMATRSTCSLVARAAALSETALLLPP